MAEDERKNGCFTPSRGPGNGSGLGSEDDLSEDALMIEQMRGDHPCSGCYHWRGDFYRSCNYIFDVGHCRPCAPGEGCTKKTPSSGERFKPWK